VPTAWAALTSFFIEPVSRFVRFGKEFPVVRVDMSEKEEYRRFAGRLMRLADEAKSPNVKARLLKVADELFRLAIQGDAEGERLVSREKAAPMMSRRRLSSFKEKRPP
jgi:hypothetical protein